MLLRYVLLSVALLGAALFVFPNTTQASAFPANSAINIVAQATTPAATPTPVPTATPAPTPTPVVLPTSISPAPGSSNNLPVIPIFFGIILLGLILAAVVPFLRSRLRR